LRDTFQDLKDALYKEGFPLDDKIISEECKTKEEYHPPTAEEVLEEQIYEEICQEDIHNEDLGETLVSIISLNEGEVVVPPAHEEEEMINISDTNDPVEDPSDTVDQHIDDFVCVGRRRWGVCYIIFYGDPIYNVEGSCNVPTLGHHYITEGYDDQSSQMEVIAST
jgi:hypothetical protein